MGAFNSVNSDAGNQSGQNSDRPGEETDTEFEDTHSEIIMTQPEARVAEGRGVTNDARAQGLLLPEGRGVINRRNM